MPGCLEEPSLFEALLQCECGLEMFHTNNVERSPLYPLCFSGCCIHGRYEAGHCVLSSSISVWFNGEMPWDTLQCVVHCSADNQAKEDISSFCT